MIVLFQIYRQSKLMGDGFCAPLNNSDTMSNFGGYYGKAAAYNTGAVVNNIDERKLLRGGDMSLVFLHVLNFFFQEKRFSTTYSRR